MPLVQGGRGVGVALDDAPSASVSTTGVGVLVMPEAHAVSAIYRRVRPRRARQEELAFLLTWATLLQAGTPMALSLRRLAEIAADRAFAASLIMLADGVERGYPLGAMLGAYLQLFPAWWGGCIAIGESTGQLPRVLVAMRQFLLERDALRRQFAEILLMPSVTAGVAVAALGIILSLVLPKLIGCLGLVGVPLPAPLAWYSRSGGWLWTVGVTTLCVGILSGLVTYRYAARVSWARRRLDHLRLQVPIFGPLMRKYELLRFLHGLKLMVGEGASLPRGIETVGQSSTNVIIHDATARIAHQLEHGVPLAEALGELPIMLPEAAQITAVGWMSGRLEPMLERYLVRLEQGIQDDGRAAVTAISHAALMLLATVVATITLLFYGTLFLSLARLLLA